MKLCSFCHVSWLVTVSTICFPHLGKCDTTFHEHQSKKKKFRHLLSDDDDNGIGSGQSTLAPPHQHTPFQPRIIGGQDAPENEFPFMIKWGGCGATLIHGDIVLSAAHCNEICTNHVLVGAHEVDNTDNGAEYRTIKGRRVHPNFNEDTLEYDFLVMKLNETVSKKPVALPSGLEPSDDETLTVIGFGAVDDDHYYGSSILQEVDVPAVPQGECNKRYGDDMVEEIMFCAGDYKGGKDSCQGDSGGPILNSDRVQVGVVSWGQGCGLKGYPGVYARISAVIDWINEQICELSENPPQSCPDRRLERRLLQQQHHRGLSEETVEVAVTVNFDEFPEEVSLKVVSERTGEVFSNFPFGSFTCATSHTENLKLLPGTYRVEIGDKFGDGLCCEHGEGGVEIRAIRPGKEDEVLAESDGNYGEGKDIQFIVPSSKPQQPPPTPVLDPDCQDAGNGVKFVIDETIGEKNCEWLSTQVQQNKFDHLCLLLDVAYACKRTCNKCDHFSCES